MKFPLASTVQIASYVAQQQRKGERYPLVLMLEPTLAATSRASAAGRSASTSRTRRACPVEECIDAGVQCPAPVVSICGGEPLVYKGIEEVVEGFLELNKNIELCTNALRLEQFLDVFEPSKRLTFVVHLDGMREIHDYICDYPGLWDIAVDAIKQAARGGFRVTTNTTIFKETDPNEVVEMMGYLTERGRHRRDARRARLPVLADRPDADDDAREHEEKFRVIRSAARKHGYRWLASPIYQDFLTGERKLACAPWGSITRNPYGWKGPCYLLTDGIFPTYEALLDGIEWEEYGPGNDARCEHCAIHSGFEPSAAFERPAASGRPSAARHGR
jgi:hopanoid biosynthesis associated radical SAM protein HpnH